MNVLKHKKPKSESSSEPFYINLAVINLLFILTKEFQGKSISFERQIIHKINEKSMYFFKRKIFKFLNIFNFCKIYFQIIEHKCLLHFFLAIYFTINLLIYFKFSTYFFNIQFSQVVCINFTSNLYELHKLCVSILNSYYVSQFLICKTAINFSFKL